MRVAYFQRKPRKNMNFSIEFIFDDVRRRLAGAIDAHVRLCPFESEGAWRRIANLLAAPWGALDVNHVTGDVGYVGILLPRRRTIQTVLDCGPLGRTRGLRHWILKKVWFEWPIRRCARVTVISEATHAELLRYVPCAASKVTVVPVAISDAFRRVERRFNAKRPTILQVGTAPNKNLHRLIEALRGLDCHLEVIGAPDSDAMRLLESHGISSRWRSSLEQGEVVRAYAEADIVTLASTVEGFGMPILEAQATGRPVVTSGMAPMDSVSGGAASFVDPFDVQSIRLGIDRVVEDAAFRARIVDGGLVNVKRFDADAIAAKYLELYVLVAQEGRV